MPEPRRLLDRPAVGTLGERMAGVFEIGVWCLLILASITDILWGKVYNALTFPFLFAGLLLHFFSSGVVQAGTSLLAIGTAFAVFFPLYFAKIMAAGDVKLLMAAGAWLDPESVLRIAGVSIVLGAVVGLIIMVARKGIVGATKSLSEHLSPSEKKQSTRVPFAPAFLCAFSILKIAESRGWSI